jgi:tetratricopeptide (TPR) repeat protein
MTMFDIAHTAQSIAGDWPGIIGKLPKDLSSRLDVYDATTYVDDPYTGVDASKITAANAAQTITDLAEALAAREKFAEARNAVRRALALDILRTAGTLVPELIETIRPEFEQAVSDFTEAVGLLPEQVTHDTLVDSGPAVLAAYQTAVAANQVLARLDQWLGSLTGLPAYAGRAPETARVLRPSTRSQLQMLLGAGERKFLQLTPLYVVAVRAGIPFDLLDPIEASRLREELDAMPVERKPIQFLNVHAAV